MTLLLENLIRLLDELDDVLAKLSFSVERLFARPPKERRRSPRINLVAVTQAS
jgi:hypothetical protein